MSGRYRSRVIPSQVLAYTTGEVLHSAACDGRHSRECTVPVPQQIAVGQLLPAGGFSLAVYDFGTMRPAALMMFPDWEEFQLVAAGHRLIEEGWMIAPGARAQLPAVNGWLRLPRDTYIVPVIPTEGAHHG